jgi:hypothetical protein
MMPVSVARADELDFPIEEDSEQPYTYVSCASCSLSISSGNATISYSIDGKSGTTSTSVTVYLEKLVYGTWNGYTSWSHSGGRNLSGSDSISLNSGTYRVRMYVSATGTDGSESFEVIGNTAGC